MAYLKYLASYWSLPEYSRYLLSPSCLDVLEMILSTPNPATLARLKDPAFRTLLFEQQFYWWQSKHTRKPF